MKLYTEDSFKPKKITMKTGEKTAMQKLRLEIQNYCGDQLFIDIYMKLFDKYLELELNQINDVYNRGKENAPLNFESLGLNQNK